MASSWTVSALTFTASHDVPNHPDDQGAALSRRTAGRVRLLGAGPYCPICSGATVLANYVIRPNPAMPVSPHTYPRASGIDATTGYHIMLQVGFNQSQVRGAQLEHTRRCAWTDDRVRSRLPEVAPSTLYSAVWEADACSLPSMRGARTRPLSRGSGARTVNAPVKTGAFVRRSSITLGSLRSRKTNGGVRLWR
jgi:hypothetical protein